MLYVKMLSTFTCLPLSHKHSVFDHVWKNVEFCSSKQVAAGFRYNGFHPRCAVDWQLLPAAVRRPLSHVAELRPVADQEVALDDHVLIVPSKPKHCGAQPGWAARQGMFLLTLTSWCGNFLASALLSSETHRTASMQRGGCSLDQVGRYCLEVTPKSLYLRLTRPPQLVKMSRQNVDARMTLASSGRQSSVLHALVPIALFKYDLYYSWSLRWVVAWLCWPAGHFRACITQEMRCLPHSPPTPALVFAATQPNMGCLH